GRNPPCWSRARPRMAAVPCCAPTAAANAVNTNMKIQTRDSRIVTFSKSPQPRKRERHVRRLLNSGQLRSRESGDTLAPIRSKPDLVADLNGYGAEAEGVVVGIAYKRLDLQR